MTRAVDLGTAKLIPDVDRPRAWLLTVDGVLQSYVDLDAPTHLAFEYARWLGHLLDRVADPELPLDVLHLGGGGLSLPRYVAATRRGSRQTVVELDGGLADLVTEHLPLPAGEDITVRVADARQALEDAPDASADVIVSDVYHDRRVPARLTSVGYARAAARVLRPHGVFAVNLADTAPFDFLRPQLANLAAVFPERCLVAEPATLRGRRFGNALLIGSAQPLPLEGLGRWVAADTFPARVEHGAALERLVAGAQPVPDEDAQPSPPPPDGAFWVG